MAVCSPRRPGLTRTPRLRSGRDTEHTAGLRTPRPGTLVRAEAAVTANTAAGDLPVTRRAGRTAAGVVAVSAVVLHTDTRLITTARGNTAGLFRVHRGHPHHLAGREGEMIRTSITNRLCFKIHGLTSNLSQSQTPSPNPAPSKPQTQAGKGGTTVQT